MPIPHILLALIVAIVWGFNFLFVSLGLEEFHPLLLCTLRFTLASLPAIFFFKLPALSFKLIIAYGLLMFALQFSLLFLGMNAGMSPGLASLLMQIQVFFSLLFAGIFLKEKPHPFQIIGAFISFLGIGLVALHLKNTVSILGFVLILASASTWGIGNLITKKAKHINSISLIAWGSFVAIFPMIIITLVVEGPASIVSSFKHLTWRGGSALLYIVYISTWVGYGLWNWLLARYPVSLIVPYTLLVPVVGILSSVIILGEPFYLWKLVAGLLVISGLCINILCTRLLNLKLRQAEMKV